MNMKYINLVYDDENELVDLLAVPNVVDDNIENIVQQFFDWAGSTQNHGYWRKSESGGYYLALGAIEFVKWLNNYYLKSISAVEGKAKIVQSRVPYNPKYKSADF